MRQMSRAEIQEFLRLGTKTGKLAVNLPSGRPSITPVWFLFDEDGVIRITTSEASAKVKALAKDPRACFLVDLEEPPYAFVRVDATASINSDADLRFDVAKRVGVRYMGPERGSEYGDRNGGQGQVVLELTPVNITAIDGIAN